ncbi:MAG TPA: extracellular solute-binding protein [Acidimicrobiales bacterium]|nr:extracellular solute-binding protein [Acidimicrobiales bacterium]
MLALLSTTALSLAFVAAPSPLPSASAATKTVTITLGYAGGANIDPYYNHVIAAAEKALPGIVVKQVVYATYDDQLDEMPTEIAARTIPDIIVWDNSAPVGQYVQQGAIMGLNKLVASAGVNLSVDPAALVHAWTINGNLYGIPLYLQDSAYVYNLGMLKAAGITTLPSSMQQVAADALAVHSKTGKAGLTILDNLFHLTQYVLAFGGGWGFGKTIGSSANAAGLGFLVNLFDEHAAVLPDQVGASWDGVAVADNEAAISDGGPWYIGFMAATAPKVSYALTPIPSSSGKQFVVTYGGSYSITAHSPDPAADIQLIKYLTDAAAERYVATDTSFGFVPAMTQYINLYRQMTPRYANITNAVLASGLTLDYPPSTIQFGNALVSGFENIVLRHSGTVASLLSSLQKQYGTK